MSPYDDSDDMNEIRPAVASRRTLLQSLASGFGYLAFCQLAQEQSARAADRPLSTHHRAGEASDFSLHEWWSVAR